MDEARTLELVPIGDIERIITTDESYRDFMQDVNEFCDVDKEAYVEAINHYMAYAIAHNASLKPDDFNRVNYINLAHGIDKIYDYQVYLASTEPLVSIDLLYKIISDEEVFTRFMNFDNEKEYFGELDLQSCLISLLEFIDYYDNSGIEFSDFQLKRIKDIKKKYSLRLHRNIKLDGYNVDDTVDAILFKHIIDRVDITREPFYVARAVYIELGKLVSYDPTFLALDQNVSIEEANAIYNKRISEISLANNKVVCKDWAELYATILNLLGIKATVVGGFHKYVTLDCDGTLIKADATNTVYVSEDSLSMPDIARIQAGLSTGGYTCLEDDKDITGALEEVDRELEFTPTPIENKISDLEQRYLSIKKQEETYEEKIFDSIDFLRRVSRDSKLDNLELFKYIIALANALFDKNRIYGVENKFICIRDINNQYSAATLISFLSSSNNYRHMLFTKGNLDEISKEDLITRINEGEIKILGKNKLILGIDKESTNGFTK